MLGFERRRSLNDLLNLNLVSIESDLDNEQLDRIERIKRNWNFYEGYHWEEIPQDDKSEITNNYCRAFVDKFVSFELGLSFTFTLGKANDMIVTDDNRTLFEYLEDVWIDNSQYRFITELGISKSVTGEAWVQVKYESIDEIDDPFNEYPNGRLRIILVPSSVIFPEFDSHDKDKLRRLTIMYQYEKWEKTPILAKPRKKYVTFKQIWEKDRYIIVDDNESVEYENRYGVIPFIQVKNLPIPGREYGRSDLEDIIPINTELNMKKSDISEIIDYHAAPITIVYGAKIGNLEKGANKVWGGLSKDAKVENLSSIGDLAASNIYVSTLRSSMCEIAGIPESVLGSAQGISNTSGVAMQYLNLPLIEKTRIKRNLTEDGLERLNKMILLVSLKENLISKSNNFRTKDGFTDETKIEVSGENMSNRDFFENEVSIPDTLPKDTLLELQQIQVEMALGLEDRTGAMKRLNRENIDQKLKDIDVEREALMEIEERVKSKVGSLNSGFTNGSTPVEIVRKEITGSNGMSNDI